MFKVVIQVKIDLKFKKLIAYRSDFHEYNVRKSQKKISDVSIISYHLNAPMKYSHRIYKLIPKQQMIDQHTYHFLTKNLKLP